MVVIIYVVFVLMKFVVVCCVVEIVDVGFWGRFGGC